MLKQTIKTITIIFVIYLIYSIGYYVGTESKPPIEKVSGIINKEVPENENIDFSIFWKTWAEVENRYVDRGEIDKEAMVFGAIQGMINSLQDPYTTFFDPESAQIFKEDINGSFGGIGAEIGFRKGALTIISPLKNSPAEKAGLKSQDIVVEIDGEPTLDISLGEAVSKIRGPKGEDVTLTIAREGEDDFLKITITRDIIQIPTIDSEIKEGNIGYIKLYNFTGDASNLFKDEVKKLKKSGAERFIIDLRNNPGGFLSAAIEISSTIVPKGDIVAIEDFGNGKGQKEYRSKGYGLLEGYPVVVLINEGSASASEIFAGAVQGLDKVKIVGSKSFGKGSVQEVVDITKDTFLKVTVAKWLTPKEVSIQDEGITPDIVVEDQDIEKESELQLKKAIEILKEL